MRRNKVKEAAKDQSYPAISNNVEINNFTGILHSNVIAIR